jgi:hypothetical protein
MSLDGRLQHENNLKRMFKFGREKVGCYRVLAKGVSQTSTALERFDQRSSRMFPWLKNHCSAIRD